jgi:hypothetical protein
VALTVTPEPADPTQTFVIGPAVFGALPVIVTELVPTGTDDAVQLTADPFTVQALPGQLAVMLVTPAGSVSLITTLGATLGPAFETAIVQVIVPPAATGFGVAVFTSVIAAFGLTTVVTVHAVASTVTPVPPVATQVFVIGPGAFGALPVIVTVLVPTGSDAAVHVAVCAATVQLLPGQLAAMFVTPAGKLSLTTTFVAGDGPMFVTAIDQVIVPPAATGFGVAVFTRVTFDFGVTVVGTLQAVALIVAPGSALATQVFVIEPGVAGAEPVMVMGALPTASVGRVHVANEPAIVHVQPAPDAAMFVTPDGNVSLTTTPVAVFGPALLTAIVHVIVAPATTGFGVAVLDTVMLECGVTVVPTVHCAVLTVAPVAVATHVFVIVPGAVGDVALIVIGAMAPTANDGREHVSVCAACVHVQPVPLAATPVTPAGSVSVMTTFVAAAVPVLVRLRVQLIGEAVGTDGAEAVLLTASAGTPSTWRSAAHCVLLTVTLLNGATAVAEHVLVIVPT